MNTKSLDNQSSIFKSLWLNFLGNSPQWYKVIIVIILLFNPIIILAFGPTILSSLILVEFIFTLIMALNCYPLLPGGLIVLEAIFLGLTTPESVYHEVLNNISVILLLIFMISAIYFMKELLLAIFTKILLTIRNKIYLSLIFIITTSVLSAFLDALTVTAVVITALYGFYNVYHNTAPSNHAELEQFRHFLQSLVMHAAVGTALGGVCTLIGEPQNLLIAQYTKWHFIDFFYKMSAVTMPVFFIGISLCVILEKFKLFGYGQEMPQNVYNIISSHQNSNSNNTPELKAKLIVQSIVGLLLVLALGFHIAEIGLIGLTMLILLASFNGIIEEPQIGKAFKEALPFTALIIIFFAIISIINQQQLFQPLINYILHIDQSLQPSILYLANGLLSAISDNVFVASIYITQINNFFVNGLISAEQFNKLAIAINTGTNIPSIATPNGQAAFLFLLTSALAPLIKLSYGRMVYMALPYTVVLTLTGLLMINFI